MARRYVIVASKCGASFYVQSIPRTMNGRITFSRSWEMSRWFASEKTVWSNIDLCTQIDPSYTYTYQEIVV